jgi:PIN domain nuclease of toxin-antitoxin system
MRILLDTQAFLWWVFADSRLSRRATRVIGDETNECLVSLASAWELAIKTRSGKLRLTQPVADFVPAELRANGFVMLEIRFAHIALIEDLPWHHRDPFDRLLAAQALAEQLAVVSIDPAFDSYGVERVW